MLKAITHTVLLLSLMLVAITGNGQGRAVVQRAQDDQTLTEYFEKKQIAATKTKSGLYYVISQAGSGKNSLRGQTVTVNYTGRLMDGTIFDSNLDPQFKHVTPLTFSVGMGQVIKGWDEGLMLMNKGTKGTLYIPSGLAYGERGMPPTIPPNAILVFDVELLNIEK